MAGNGSPESPDFRSEGDPSNRGTNENRPFDAAETYELIAPNSDNLPESVSDGTRPTGTTPTDETAHSDATPAQKQKSPEASPLFLPETDPENPDPLTASPEHGEMTVPYWLGSAVLHLILLIILALLFFSPEQEDGITLTSEIYAEQEGEQLEADLLGAELTEQVVLTPENLPEVDDPFAKSTTSQFDPFAESTAVQTVRSQIGLALEGRRKGSKESLLGAYGGTATTEAAVQLGLKWLARNQLPSGQWSLKGPFRGGSSYETPSAATAMALLAFLGNGHTHVDQSPYTSVVKRGMYQLLTMQDADGCFFTSGGTNHRFYAHAQGTIAVCELYAMTKDPELRQPAEKAIEYLIDTQDYKKGGWRYQPRNDSDLSVTGWVVMALQSAKMAGISVPEKTLKRVGFFLDSVSVEEGSRYGYLPKRAATPSMTAEGLLCRQYLGWPQNDRRLVRGVEWLTMQENLIDYNKSDTYYWYYATQVTHHMGGNFWQRWNEVMRQEVPEHQVKKGKEAGSWNPGEASSFDMAGGRLYVTCLSIYMLEVYYRHLPLYENVYSLPLN